MEEKIARPNDQDVRNKLLITAVIEKSLIVAEELLTSLKPPNVNFAHNGLGWSAIFFAGKNEDWEMINLLLDHGAEINFKDSNGESILFELLNEDKQSTVNFLVNHPKHKPELNVRDKKGDTPIIIAGIRGKPETIKILCAAGADPNFKDKNDQTPADVFALKRHFKSLAATREAGGNFSKDPKEMLFEIINARDYETAKFLISTVDLDVNINDAKGRTPLIAVIESISEEKPTSAD